MTKTLKTQHWLKGKILLISILVISTSFNAYSQNTGGWKKTNSSLLLFDKESSLIKEIGIGTWRKEISQNISKKETALGEASKNGQFAWHWLKKETLLSKRVETVTASTTSFILYGSAGQILWESPLADAPKDLPPAYLSDTGEVLLVFKRNGSSWILSAQAFPGHQLMKFSAASRIEQAGLTDNGQFAILLWGDVDAPLVYTFFDLKNNAQKTIPASETTLGAAFITSSGNVFSGGKTIFSFH